MAIRRGYILMSRQMEAIYRVLDHYNLILSYEGVPLTKRQESDADIAAEVMVAYKDKKIPRRKV